MGTHPSPPAGHGHTRTGARPRLCSTWNKALHDLRRGRHRQEVAENHTIPPRGQRGLAGACPCGPRTSSDDHGAADGRALVRRGTRRSTTSRGPAPPGTGGEAGDFSTWRNACRTTRRDPTGQDRPVWPPLFHVEQGRSYSTTPRTAGQRGLAVLSAVCPPGRGGALRGPLWPSARSDLGQQAERHHLHGPLRLQHGLRSGRLNAPPGPPDLT